MKRKKPFSVYAGETWSAFRPGEDKIFTDAWVSRRGRDELCTVTNSRADLLANAKWCQVTLQWQPKPNPKPTKKRRRRCSQ